MLERVRLRCLFGVEEKKLEFVSLVVILSKSKFILKKFLRFILKKFVGVILVRFILKKVKVKDRGFEDINSDCDLEIRKLFCLICSVVRSLSEILKRSRVG